MNAPRQAPRFLRWLAWLPLVIASTLFVATLLAQVTVCVPAAGNIAESWGWFAPSASTLIFAIFCGLIVTRQPHNRIGWLCGAIAAMQGIFLGPMTVLLNCTAQGLITPPGLPYLAWLISFGGLLISLEFLLLPLWFPDGRFLSTGWRRFAQVAYSLLILSTLAVAVWPGQLFMLEMSVAGLQIDNPFGLPIRLSPDLMRLLQVFNSVSLLVGILIAQFSLFARWRRSSGQTRQQLKVFAFFVVTIGTVFMVFELIGQLLYTTYDLFNLWGGWLYGALLVLLWAGYPVAMGVAVLKYRMYDVDIVIRRTLQYSAVTGLLALIYFGSVFLLQRLFSSATGQQSPLALVVSTLLIAAIFAPLRRRIQDAIDRRFYRRKYNAQQVLAQFARTARDETDMDALLAELERVIQETLQPDGVRVWLKSSTARLSTGIDLSSVSSVRKSD